MPTRAYSVEDGNLATKSIVTSQSRTYTDIDLSFQKKTLVIFLRRLMQPQSNRQLKIYY